MITAKTKITGIFGDPVEHSLSPIIHNEAFRHLNLDYCYLAFNVKREKLREAVEAIRALQIVGVNITLPHKESVINYLDEISDEANYIGAVNTILNDKGYLRGFNTDAFGFIQSLKEEGVNLQQKDILVLGAGGAAKAIVYGVLKEGGNVYIYNRTISKAEEIKKRFSTLGTIEVLKNLDKSFVKKIYLVVNATSLGLKENDPMPINPTFLNKDIIYCDIVYPNTKLMKETKRIGCKVIGGLGMLIWQAANAFEIWTKQKAPVERMKKILNKFLTKR
ncbi:MAG: shikimate dehydrogenase [Thermodesulfovibrio sp.]|nr:shikimate dehydrogenase [Thermodesulfovibrio sp.]